MSILNKWIERSGNYGRTGVTRVSALDGWRGLAIAIVLLSHFGTLAYSFPFERILFGRMGVDLFFVLSGLLMSNILFVKRTPLKTFYQRRFSRIFPVFFVYVTLVYVAGWVVARSDEFTNYFYTLFFLRTYLPTTVDIWHTDLPITHLWSLNVEEHSYILLSALTLLAAIKFREYYVLIALGFIAIGIRYLGIRYPEFSNDVHGLRTESAASHLMFSAGYFLIKDKFAPYVKSWMPVLAFAIGIFSYSQYAPWMANWTVAPLAFAFAVNHVTQMPRWLISFFSLAPLQLLGIWSYSIYLWQEVFYYVYSHSLIEFYGNSFLLLAGAIGTGLMSFYYLENPVRRLINDRFS